MRAMKNQFHEEVESVFNKGSINAGQVVGLVTTEINSAAEQVSSSLIHQLLGLLR